ncbi:methyl-accepting chemotaxis protein [Paraburkholderia sp. D15]|uniref:methyl-accepting chemotaxis protein n=1 Tax=Paraburkholderia sp. D15 TaxID=2880218 RepID=UPI00247A537F|nr:methyl-accepting chemotaxis protein [Paraburkholderia sp. D15]
MVKNLKISTRLRVGFGGLLFLLFLIAVLGNYALSAIYGRLDNIAHVANAETRLSYEIREQVVDRSFLLRTIVLLDDAKAVNAQIDRVRTLDAAIDETYRQLGHLFSAEGGGSNKRRELYAQLQADEAATRPFWDKAIKLRVSNDRAGATRVLTEEVTEKAFALRSRLNELVAVENERNDQTARDAEMTYRTVRWTMLTVAAFALLLGIGSASLITRGILTQLGGEPALAQDLARRISAGDLTSRITLRPGDSSSLMAFLDAMRNKLSIVVADIKASAESVSAAADEIAQGNVDLSQRTEEQAASLEETAASMEELTSTVRQNTENARHGSALADSASETAAAGGAVVVRVVNTMEGISRSSSKVAEIINVIEGISFQTNILALNAAVEAARAGEQGRGFAVVAAEVRTLAQRSATAAREIKELITTSVQQVTEGSTLVQDAGQTMGEIVRSVKRVTDIIGDIASASAEQSTGIEQVNLAVSQMDEMTQQNAALVEQATAAAQAMANQAQSLRAAVAIFKVHFNT